MKEKWKNWNYNASLYKKIAFSTKFYYFSDQKWHILHLKKKYLKFFFFEIFKKFFSSNLAKLWPEKVISKNLKKNFEKKKISNFFFSNAECAISGHWNKEIWLKMQILFCILENTSMDYNFVLVFLSFFKV